VSARSALTESVSTRKLRRDSVNLCMQGVHRRPQGVCDRVSDSKAQEE
jgi:hypothetical protein